MQSQKKHKRLKNETMSAQEFAMTWAHNIGLFTKAVIKADNYAMECRKNATRGDLTREECREAARTAGFYDNVAGILRKAQVKMGAQPTPKRQETKSVKKDTADRRPAAT